ncbi:MAG: alpha/beta hydrolase [Acidobacteria bacterium]|nr:alpha/beta hydrolase [Acidobacteriota bacterium]
MLVPRSRRVIFSIIALLTACTSTPAHRVGVDTPLSRARARLPELAPCNLPGVDETLLCGELRRPEDPDQPEGRSIKVFVVVVPSSSAKPRTDAWVEVAGGPGVPSTSYARDYVGKGTYSVFRRDRDVLLMDARGMGRSNPLYCEELALHRVSSLFPRFPAEAVTQCRERLWANATLSEYSTEHAADDLEAVRRWLGYSQLNFISYSYGTRSVLTFMRRHPRSVRSAILWGVVPPDYRRPLYYARDAQIVMDRLLADCQADHGCGRAFPNVRDDLRVVLGKLDERPLPINLTHPSTKEQLPTAITRAGFAQALWVALSYPDRAHRVPLVIHHAARGNFQPFLELDVAKSPPRRLYYNAAHLSIVCPEEVQHVRAEEVDPMHRDTFMPAERAHDYRRACELWGLPALPAATLEPVRSDVPTLIISGWMDPFTPPELGDRVASTLTNLRHVVVRHLSHEPDGMIGAECLNNLFEQFLANPDPATLETSCVDSMKPPPFVLATETSQ